MESRTRGLLGLGLILLALFASAVVVLSQGGRPAAAPGSATPSAVTVTCYGGSEKADFIANPAVVQRLQSQGITVNFVPKGSIDQVSLDPKDLKGFDCLWPSSAAAQYLFESKNRSAFPAYRAEPVFSSPEVLYSGPETTRVLQRAHVVQARGNRYFIVNMVKLFELMRAGKQWEDLGSSIAGPIGIDGTDAGQSNSGFTLAMLELKVLAANNPYQNPTLAQARGALPKLQALREAQGLQAASSQNGFEEWLRAGGELHSQLYAGYESQLVDLWVHNPGGRTDIQNQVKVLYPAPTIMNDHVVLALTPAGTRLIDALKDPTIQDIAWKQYGFRPLSFDAANVRGFPHLPLADSLRTVNPPSAAVISALNDCVRNNRCD